MSKILVVDDDETVTNLMMTLLSMEGHQPATVNDSTKTMQVANQFEPDLVILDLMMPGLSGFEICDLLHQDAKFSNVPILIISALDDPGSRSKALQLGAREFITKPFNVDMLLAMISELTR